jgi:hypothetical protein
MRFQNTIRMLVKKLSVYAMDRDKRQEADCESRLTAYIVGIIRFGPVEFKSDCDN